ncbi:MAG: ribosome biogenesis GTP-binding protein YihA/YsxC [Terriglobales bacterium]
MRVNAKFVRSAAEVGHFPAPGPPEIAFLGRSNVGKSSLINSLLGEKMAKTSSTPGRTRAINFFEVRRPGKPRPEWLFVDLPGYGYAKLPREQTAEWPRFIEPYLQKRDTLALCVVLVDANVPTQHSDKQLIEWLQHVGRTYVIVATKADRLSGNTLVHAMQRLRRDFQTERMVSFSTRTGAGRDELWKQIFASCETPGARAVG